MSIPERLDDIREEHGRKIRRTEDQLRTAAQGLINDMQRLLRTLDEGYTVNELGEVQGRGLTVDRLCALRGEQFETQTMLDWVVKDND